jgi:small GTP-binding protein
MCLLKVKGMRASSRDQTYNRPVAADKYKRKVEADKYKILLLGNSGVGKSNYLLRLCDDSFTPSFISTIGIDYRTKNISLDNSETSTRLLIFDTAGQERFRTITSAYYRGADGVMLMYDISDRTSFDSVDRWVRNFREHTTKQNVQILLVGCKNDLEDARQVSFKDAEALALKHGTTVFETSAKTGDAVESSMLALATRMHDARAAAKALSTRQFDGIEDCGHGPVNLGASVRAHVAASSAGSSDCKC